MAKPQWQSIKDAPRDGTWIKVRGRDFGSPTGRWHYAVAFYEGANWHEVGSNSGQLAYLTDWCPLTDAE